jgi:XTP/dITP diphosphohydrolase
MSGTRRVLLATHNAKKLVELRRILAAAAADVAVVGLADVAAFPPVPETGATFAENALLKVRDAASRTGLITVADDSGLEVEALHGMPGILSARWAGRHGDDEANLRLLLAQLADTPDDRLQAAFVAAAALVGPAGETVVEGRMPGRLVREPRGGNGFGYDPIFVAEGQSQTNGELDPAVKDAISHRGQALRALVPHLLAAVRDTAD